MIKFILAVVLLVLFACSGTFSEDKKEECFKKEDASHFFWKVSDENSSVWLLGSIHFADSSFYPLDSVIETAFVNAEELAVEINVENDSVESEVSRQSLDRGSLPSGKLLNEILPRAVWTSLDSICTAWNFPVNGILHLKPWLAAMTLSVVAIQRAGIDPTLGIDAVLLDRAAMDGKAIVSLESAEEQIGALADTSESDSSGIYYLKSTLREISELDSMVAQMIRAWKTGDEDLLRRVMNQSSAENETEKTIESEIEKKVYTNRNAKMTDAVAQFLREDRNVFVVVGVAHLALDDDSVVGQLKRRGYTVERF